MNNDEILVAHFISENYVAAAATVTLTAIGIHDSDKGHDQRIVPALHLFISVCCQYYITIFVSFHFYFKFNLLLMFFCWCLYRSIKIELCSVFRVINDWNNKMLFSIEYYWRIGGRWVFVGLCIRVKRQHQPPPLPSLPLCFDCEQSHPMRDVRWLELNEHRSQYYKIPWIQAWIVRGPDWIEELWK